MAAPAYLRRTRRHRDAGLHRAALGARGAVRVNLGLPVPPAGGGKPVPLRRLPRAGRADLALQRAADRYPEGDRRVLGRRPELGAATGPLDAVRPVRVAARRAHVGPGREVVLRLGERGVRRRVVAWDCKRAYDYVRPV